MITKTEVKLENGAVVILPKLSSSRDIPYGVLKVIKNAKNADEDQQGVAVVDALLEYTLDDKEYSLIQRQSFNEIVEAVQELNEGVFTNTSSGA